MSKKKKRHVEPRRATPDVPLLSVCMIVRDEEADLERCLCSVKAAADEIIVVDTGSSDRSVEIARRNGAKVFPFEWCDDFSAARNAALAQAAGRWILQIDADEELTAEAAGKIRRVIAGAASRCWGFYIPEVVYYTKDGALQHNLAHRLLLFRNSTDLRYRYRIHENIMYSGRGPAPDFLFADDLQVIHHGYLLDEDHLKEKQRRNHRLLQLAIADNPEDPFLQFNLGKHYYGTGRIAAAVEPLKRAAKLCHNSSAAYLASVYTMLVVALSQSGHEGEVQVVVAEAERRLRAPTADFFCSAGSAYQAIGQLNSALHYFQRAIKAGSAPSTAGSDPATHTWRPRFGIGFIHEVQGRLESSFECYEEALTYAPGNPVLHGRIATTAAKLGRVDNALEHIRLALQSEVLSQEICWELLEVCEAFALSGGEGTLVPSGLTDVGSSLVKRISPTAELNASR